MTFASPLALLALLAVPVAAALAVVAGRRRAHHPLSFSNLDVLASVAERSPAPLRRLVPPALLLLALAVAATAVAQPRVSTEVSQKRAVVVLVVDDSGSMDATDVKPSRIVAAAAAMRAFVQRLPASAELGLVEFSTTPTVVNYPTTDHQTVLGSIGYLAPNGATALGDGLTTALKVVEQVGGSSRAAPGAPRGVIVLLSDGAQTRGAVQPLAAAHEAKADGVPVDTIAFGTPKGTMRYEGYPDPIPVPPDPKTMKQIASITGGREFAATTAGQIADAYKKLGTTVGREHSHRAISSWFAVAAATLLAGAALAGRGVATPME